MADTENYPDTLEEAKRWLERHGVDDDGSLDLERDTETGETVGGTYREPEVLGGRRVGSYHGWRGEPDQSAEDLLDGADVVPPWGRGEDDGTGPGYSLEQRVQAERVRRVLDLMPAEYGNLLRARFLESKELADIGTDLGISYQSVQKRLRTAKREFMRVLGENFAAVWPVDMEEL